MQIDDIELMQEALRHIVDNKTPNRELWMRVLKLAHRKINEQPIILSDPDRGSNVPSTDIDFDGVGGIG